jgi:hypothetical protein
MPTLDDAIDGRGSHCPALSAFSPARAGLSLLA